MDWLTQLTNWLAQLVKDIWQSLVDFLAAYLVNWVSTLCDLFATAIESIPVPDFLTTYSMDGLLSQTGPTVTWLVGEFKIGQCLAIIGAGFAFRLLRKLFTLGQW